MPFLPTWIVMALKTEGTLRIENVTHKSLGLLEC